MDIGSLYAVSVQDWMCEPDIRAATGLTIRDHQELTLESYMHLKHMVPDVPWMPVLQGQTLFDYQDHIKMYQRYGTDVYELPLVGIGSVCRRSMHEAIYILKAFLGIKIHALGLNVGAMQEIAPLLTSADSMAWSYEARKAKPLPDHTHQTCANCLEYATLWHDRTIEKLHDQ